ncbi:unnamed protein product, partial [Scytosiphon promiscuus]
PFELVTNISAGGREGDLKPGVGQGGGPQQLLPRPSTHTPSRRSTKIRLTAQQGATLALLLLLAASARGRTAGGVASLAAVDPARQRTAVARAAAAATATAAAAATASAGASRARTVAARASAAAGGSARSRAGGRSATAASRVVAAGAKTFRHANTPAGRRSSHRLLLAASRCRPAPGFVAAVRPLHSSSSSSSSGGAKHGNGARLRRQRSAAARSSDAAVDGEAWGASRAAAVLATGSRRPIAQEGAAAPPAGAPYDRRPGVSEFVGGRAS